MMGTLLNATNAVTVLDDHNGLMRCALRALPATSLTGEDYL